MADLIALIKEKQAAIAKLREELSAAEALLTGKPRLQPIEGTRSSPTPVTPPPRKRKRGAKTKRARAVRRLRRIARAIKGGEIVATSSVGRTVAVLRRAGKPLHVADIIKQIEAEGHQVNKTTLVGNLSRYVAAGRIFYRAAPSVFGLVEMRKG